MADFRGPERSVLLVREPEARKATVRSPPWAKSPHTLVEILSSSSYQFYMRKIFSILAAIVFSSASQAAAPTVDLLDVYPQARTELISLASCRASYVGQHYKDAAPSEVISERSAEACKVELKAFLSKIGKPNGDPVFIAKLDQLVISKITKVRSFGGVMPGAGPVWARCVTAHLDRTLAQTSPDIAWNDAYAACHDEERAAYDAFRATGTSANPAEFIDQMKKALRSSVR